MRWRKRGIVYCPDGTAPWARVGAMIPTPIELESSIRVYFTSVDDAGMGRPAFIEVAKDDPSRVLAQSAAPCLDIGRPGTFDENGVLVCSIVAVGKHEFFMYYVGFELGTKIRYRLLSGLAISSDGGRTFARLRETPILERSPTELFFRGGPYVIREDGRFRMWYVAGSSWTELNGKAMPEYVVRYLESADGTTWGDAGGLCIDVQPGADEHGFGRPWVMRTSGGRYEMFYSVRRRSLAAYRLGYALSADGLVWLRRDAEIGLDVSPDGFDRQAIMYAAIVDIAGRRYCFYNGDDFGRAGIGLAELER
jgi:hypothetical protein